MASLQEQYNNHPQLPKHTGPDGRFPTRNLKKVVKNGATKYHKFTAGSKPTTEWLTSDVGHEYEDGVQEPHRKENHERKTATSSNDKNTNHTLATVEHNGKIFHRLSNSNSLWKRPIGNGQHILYANLARANESRAHDGRNHREPQPVNDDEVIHDHIPPHNHAPEHDRWDEDESHQNNHHENVHDEHDDFGAAMDEHVNNMGLDDLENLLRQPAANQNEERVKQTRSRKNNLDKIIANHGNEVAGKRKRNPNKKYIQK